MGSGPAFLHILTIVTKIVSHFLWCLGVGFRDLVNGERSDGSFCTVLHRHLFPSIVLLFQGISTLLPMALFYFKYPHSWTLFLTTGCGKLVIFGLLNAMSLESCSSHFQQAFTASNQHIIWYMDSNATTAEYMSLQSFNDLQHIEWPLFSQ